MESIRDLLRKELGHSLESLPEVERLAAAWPVIAGHSIAIRSEVTAFSEDACTVEVSGADWLPQLQSMEGSLRARLQEVAKVPLRAIHFQQKP